MDGLAVDSHVATGMSASRISAIVTVSSIIETRSLIRQACASALKTDEVGVISEMVTDGWITISDVGLCSTVGGASICGAARFEAGCVASIAAVGTFSALGIIVLTRNNVRSSIETAIMLPATKIIGWLAALRGGSSSSSFASHFSAVGWS